MQFRRGDAEEDLSKNEMMMRFGPSTANRILEYQLYKK
jgi:hypothetical protein